MDTAALALATIVIGRAPGTTGQVDGVRLASHSTRITEHGVTRRVEIDDVVANDASTTLEARYSFRLPSGAALARVSLEIGGAMVDGELIRGERGRDIFTEIVDTRRRDPALVERAADGTVSVKIFPVPAHETRRIVVAYDAPTTRAPLGAELALGRDGFVLRVASPAPAPPGAEGASPTPRSHAIIVDTSHGRTDTALREEIEVARRLVDDLPDGTAFAVLACDSACDNFPNTGTVAKTADTSQLAGDFLRNHGRGGARDVVGAARAAAISLGGSGRITYVGSARATAGALEPREVAREVKSAIGASAFEGIAIDDAGELGDLAVACAPPVSLPSGLLPLTSHYESGVLTVTGALAANVTGTLRVNGGPQRVTSTRDAKTVDRLFLQARIDTLERKGGDKNLERAGAIARANRLLARRASFIVLETEEMFADYGIARSPGAAKAPPPPKRDPHIRPMLREASVMVTGRLPPENVRHVMTMNHARFRFCYEQGLSEQPALAGRVTVKFRIESDGTVTTAQDGGSDIQDAEVIACVVDVVKTLSFMADTNTSVTVIYPFAFTPEEDLPQGRPLFHLRIPKAASMTPHDLWVLRARAASHPDDKALYEELGGALENAGRTHDAARAWDALADLSPERADVHWMAATAYARTLDFTRAMSHAIAATQLRPSDEHWLREHLTALQIASGAY